MELKDFHLFLVDKTRWSAQLISVVPELREKLDCGEEQLILVGGSITTKNRLDLWQTSYAHILEDGRVFRYDEHIGDCSQVDFLTLQ